VGVVLGFEVVRFVWFVCLYHVSGSPGVVLLFLLKYHVPKEVTCYHCIQHVTGYSAIFIMTERTPRSRGFDTDHSTPHKVTFRIRILCPRLRESP
jgi:hypothetical protein